MSPRAVQQMVCISTHAIQGYNIEARLFCDAGCGFLDTVTKLIKLGSDVNARDLTHCTPLQNAAHGTYSALATMPLNGSQGGASGVDLRLGSHVPAFVFIHMLLCEWLQ